MKTKKSKSQKPLVLNPLTDLVVSLYKFKFENMKPMSKALREFQTQKIVRPDTTYAQGYSDGFDTAIQCFQNILETEKINLKENGK